MRGLLKKKMIGGLASGASGIRNLDPARRLWCATEVTKRVDMDAVAAALDFVTASVTEAEPVMAAKG